MDKTGNHDLVTEATGHFGLVLGLYGKKISPLPSSYFQAQFTRHGHIDLIWFTEHLLCAEYPLGTGETAGTKTDMGPARRERRVGAGDSAEADE